MAPAIVADNAEPVPFVRLDNADPDLMAHLLAAVERVASQAAFTLGEEVEAFEREFAAYCDARACVGVSSGTEALVLVLRALEIGSGDEVILPGNSFVATAEAVSLTGATPRFVDVDPETWTLTAETVAPAIGPRTRAILPVHLYGRTVDLDPILRLASEAAAHVVEDACQAHGARYWDRRVGALGTAGCFSFYPAKNLGAWGDGGAVVTDDLELADRVRLLRSHGERPRYHHRVVGTTARLDAIQAAILRPKLVRLDEANDGRRRAAARLDELLAGAPVVRPAPLAPGHDHVHHLFVVCAEDRDGLREHLAARGVASGVHYPVPIHLTEAYADLGYASGSLPVVEHLAEQVVSLPMFPTMTSDEARRVAEAVTSMPIAAMER